MTGRYPHRTLPGLVGLNRIVGTPTAPRRKYTVVDFVADPDKPFLQPNRVVEPLDYEQYEWMWIQSNTRLTERAVRLPEYRDPVCLPRCTVKPFSPKLRAVMDKYPWIEWLPEGITKNCTTGCTPYQTHLDLLPMSRTRTIL